ncbi:hypothetical protein Nepgr_018966 [Nepenthes gracilis]|uniref:Uncharacterized protein n=1 Tax=Nepenthes gracilis TaxID=150966 RepID=A0AAD3SUD1_NEPGR|nr:hypothetical protein Nepgr_018966 [Nepenthes gracilis]
MASLASISAPSALHFITVRLSDKKTITPLRDKIGWCISRNSSSVNAQISCRRLCLNGKEIGLAGSINDLRSSSHPVKNMMNSWGQAILGGKGSKSALQTKAGVPGLENTLVLCLERISKSKYGGLRTDFEAIRALACKAVFSLFENLDDKSVSPAHLTIACDAYPLLLGCLVTGDEQIAAASRDAIKNSIENFTSSPESITTIFPADSIDASDPRNLMAQGSSVGCVRVLALIVKLFSGLLSVTSVIYTSKLLALLESEVNGATDTLVTRSVLELWYETTEGKQAVEPLSKTILLQQISTLARNTPMEPIFWSRAMIICGRVLSKENTFRFIDESSVSTVISTIEGRSVPFETGEADECESALEAFSPVGSPVQGVTLLPSPPDASRFVIGAAVGRQGSGEQRRGKHPNALQALGNIAGKNHPQNASLNGDAEEHLRLLIYEVAYRRSKLTLSGLCLSILQQES